MAFCQNAGVCPQDPCLGTGAIGVVRRDWHRHLTTDLERLVGEVLARTVSGRPATTAQVTAASRTLPGGMSDNGETPEDGAGAPLEIAPRRVGFRQWVLRVFVLTLLLAGAGTVAAAAVTIVRSTDDAATTRSAQFGVLMPDATQYQAVVKELLARKRPRQLTGLTVVGEDGKVTVLHAKRRSAKSFPSDYLNPVALALIARSVGARSDTTITVDELRLEKLQSTGRLRWRLHGTQSGKVWRATIAPNGTGFRRVPTAKAS